ncbi:MAG: methionine synthase [Rikenellaceae bacterium]|nr:methionine synthase [Rikenellaceae bacterium]
MKTNALHNALQERILLLDGGLGTMIQPYGLTEADFRGERFRDWSCDLKGCNDLLALTRPEVIREIHQRYLKAGADLITTDSFNANAISLRDYGLEHHAREIAAAAARIAREAADDYTHRNPSKPRFVAGSMGPTNRTASMSADVQNPAAREISFEELAAAYRDQALGLLEGGADLLLVETVFDTLNAKAALYAISALEEELGREIEVMLSGTLSDGGRTLSGQTVEGFYTSLKHYPLLSVGFNCAFGARQLLPYLERLAAEADCRISAHPNAGLPNVMGGYDETPEMFARDVEEYLKRGLLNIVGGCCGTTPEHIFELQKIVSDYRPRPLPTIDRQSSLSGLEPLRITPEQNFVNVGERTNVAGSAKFARLIREEKYEEALSVARAQVEAGAQVVDVCMDDGLIDGPRAMRHFLNLMASEPEIARVPVMIDSSKWEVLEAGLRATQGKSIVNSLSLKEGEQRLLQRARECHRYGAAVVVMLFDEQGQADTYARKIAVAERAYRLLTSDGFPAEDIIFDPNILAVATGIEAHNRYALDFIEAVRWIKAHCPKVKISGGVSNLSFAFRGNNTVREAMHSAFLFHAIEAGMDMGIVNTQMLQIYSTIEPKLLERVEDVLLCRRADASERLAEYAQELKSVAENLPAEEVAEWRKAPLKERIRHAMIKGISDHIEADTLEAYRELMSPMAVIDGVLMPAMEEVGQLFGAGKMFLPQVVKTARVMKKAVSVLTPYIEAGHESGKSSGRILLATVKGDVHDIGKNIVSVVMACGGYAIHDLGVMVEPQRIVDEALRLEVDAIGLSGLITPSLEEMIHVCEELERRGAEIPVLIGGATTSKLHTALKIAPKYRGAVIHVGSASDNVRVMAELMGSNREGYLLQLRQEQELLREEYQRRTSVREFVPIIEARKQAQRKPLTEVLLPAHTGRVVFNDYEIEAVEPLIDWNFFFPAWGIKGHYPEVLEHPERGEEARKLLADARALLERIKKEKLLKLQGVVGIFPAVGGKEEIILKDTKGKSYQLPMLRNQTLGEEHCSVADFVAEGKGSKTDYVAAFALTAGVGLQKLTEEFKAAGDDYSAILSKLLADRLTEAFAESVHSFVRCEMWGYAAGQQLTPEQIIGGAYRGLRMAFGYPATPDHALKRTIFDLLRAEQFTEMRLTENFMITPGEALCGLMLSDGHYFSVGRIDTKQLLDYARKMNVEPEEVRRRLPNNVTD